jgi:hypothetical protein
MPLLQEVTRNLVECNLRRLLRDFTGIFVESAICTVLLLLNCGTELEEVVGHILVRCFENVDESGGVVSMM